MTSPVSVRTGGDRKVSVNKGDQDLESVVSLSNS